MFESLQERLGGVLRRLRGQTTLTDKQVDEALREVRLALLEADVNVQVVKDFIAAVKGKVGGQEVLDHLTPGQHVVKVVHDELVRLLGGDVPRETLHPGQRNTIMLVGLQGSGKTTHAAKLAKYLTKRDHRCLLVAADIYRPAAIEQLKVLGAQIDVPVYAPGADERPERIAADGLDLAYRDSRETVIVDTAGRLHIDDAMMDELVRVKAAIKPTRIFLVLDSMVGQDAINQGRAFHERLNLSGVILTKLDGDSRGGAALSVRSVTGVPIVYAGDGEKLDDFELFHPDRMASRILGMGDMLTMIERAQEVVDQEEARRMQEKILKQTFTLEDFLKQLQHVKRMGGIAKVMKHLPGMEQLKQLQSMDVGDDEMRMIEGIIHSMTPEERRNPRLLGTPRRKRVAKGAGRKLQEVNRLLNQFEQARKMMKAMTMASTAVGGTAKTKIKERLKQQKKRGKQAKQLAAKKAREQRRLMKQQATAQAVQPGAVKAQAEAFLQQLQSIERKK